MSANPEVIEARQTLDLLARTGDSVRMGWTFTVNGFSATHKDESPTDAKSARSALDAMVSTVESLGGCVDSVSVFRHEG